MFERRERITTAEVLQASTVAVKAYTRKGKPVRSYQRKGIERSPQPRLDELLRVSSNTLKDMNRKWREEERARHKAKKEGWSVKDILNELGGREGNFFHGTTDAVLKQILKEGIIPGGHKRVWSNEFYDTADRAAGVFLVADESRAKTWCIEALRKLGGNNAILLKVAVPETERLFNDNAAGPNHFFYKGSIKPEWIKGYIKIKANKRTFKDVWGEVVTRVALQHDQARSVQIRSAASRIFYVPIITFDKEM